MHTRTATDGQSRDGCSSGVLLRAVVAVSASPYDADLSALREHVESRVQGGHPMRPPAW
jgi:hypothetical protein